MWRSFLLLMTFAALAVASSAGCVEYGSPGRTKVVPPALTFLISSNTVSNFTPCGCRIPEGGLPRRGTIFQEVEEAVEWPVLFVDTGNVSQGSTSETQRLKDKYIFQAYDLLDYAVVNVGINDVRLGSEELLRIGEEHNIPWVSCNIHHEGVYQPLPVTTPGNPASGGADPSGNPTATGEIEPGTSDRPVFASYRVVEPEGAPGYRIGFIGAMIQDATRLNNIANFSFRPYREAIREQVDALRGAEKVDLVVLLCDTDNLQQVDVEQVFEGIDLVIGGNSPPQRSPNATLNPLNPFYAGPPPDAQPEAEGEDIEETENGESGPSLEPIPLPLVIKKGTSRGKLLNRLDITLDAGGRIVDYYFDQIRVDDTHPDDPRLAEIARGYDTDVHAVELMRRVERNYAGIGTCEICHPGFDAVWSDHGHFHSYATIETAGNLDDRACTQCHAIGFMDEDQRLLTYDLIPESHHNVGCEGCHPSGQRHITLKEHIESLSPESRRTVTTTDTIGNVTPDTCRQCHTDQWSPGFDFLAAIEVAREICRSVPCQ